HAVMHRPSAVVSLRAVVPQHRNLRVGASVPGLPGDDDLAVCLQRNRVGGIAVTSDSGGQPSVARERGVEAAVAVPSGHGALAAATSDENQLAVGLDGKAIRE